MLLRLGSRAQSAVYSLTVGEILLVGSESLIAVIGASAHQRHRVQYDG